jgi:MraZ protein
MVLSGTYERTLDEKSRLVIPKRLLEDFGEPNRTHLFFTPGTEKSLWLYAPKGFERVARRVSRLPNTVQVRRYKRFFYANTERVELDSQGRIRLTERQVEFAGITGREAVLLGVHDHAEVWDAKAWSACMDGQLAHFDELAAQAFELG